MIFAGPWGKKFGGAKSKNFLLFIVNWFGFNQLHEKPIYYHLFTPIP